MVNRIGVRTKAKAFRSSNGSSNSSQSIRNCKKAPRSLEKYGQAYLRWVKWLKIVADPQHRSLINDSIDYTDDSPYEDIFKLVNLSGLTVQCVDDYLMFLNQPIKSGKRKGLPPTFSVPNTFVRTASMG